MKDWKSFLKADATTWLLEENNPSVRYFTLRNILDRPESDPEVLETGSQIMNIGAVPQILSQQQAGGYWGQPQDFYIRAKYRGTVWSFIILAELGASGQDSRIRQACEFVLANSQDRQSGAFAPWGAETGGGDHISVIPCLTGNMLRSLIRFGCLEDSRVQKGIRWILDFQRCDDGIEKAPQGWPYERSPNCWGRHTCHMGVIKTLKALAEIPAEKRPPDIQQAINKAAEYFLVHHLYKRSHNLTQSAKPEWESFGFPLMWNTDALEMLGVLASLGYRDVRMQEAVDLVLTKQDEQGRWTLEKTFNGRTRARIEQKDKPSKWITLRALTAIKRYYGG